MGALGQVAHKMPLGRIKDPVNWAHCISEPFHRRSPIAHRLTQDGIGHWEERAAWREGWPSGLVDGSLCANCSTQVELIGKLAQHALPWSQLTTLCVLLMK